MSNSSRDASVYNSLVEVMTPYRVKMGMAYIFHEYRESITTNGVTTGAHVIRLLRSNLCRYDPSIYTREHASMTSGVNHMSAPGVAYIVSSSFPFTKRAVVIPPGAETIGDVVAAYPPPDGMTYVTITCNRHVPGTGFVAKLHRLESALPNTTNVMGLYTRSIPILFPVPTPPEPVGGPSTRQNYICASFGTGVDWDKTTVMIPTDISFQDSREPNVYASLHTRIAECVTNWLLERHIDPTAFRYSRGNVTLGPNISIVHATYYGEMRGVVPTGVPVDATNETSLATHTDIVYEPGTEFHHTMQYIVDQTECSLLERVHTPYQARDTLATFLEFFDGKCTVRIDDRWWVFVKFFVKQYERHTSSIYSGFYSRYLRSDLAPVITARSLFDLEIRKLYTHLSYEFDRDTITNTDLFVTLMMNNVRRVTYTYPATQTNERVCRDAIARVQALEWLYPFQKETVVDMVRREYSGDGIMGMINTRVSGVVGDVGTFSVGNYFRVLRNDAAQHIFTMRGGILGDEPGLGKTRQTIALIKSTKEAEDVLARSCSGGRQARTDATLIVVKPNVLRQWRDELLHVWPDCRVAMFHGPKKRTYDPVTIRFDYDVVLTTYTTLVSSTRIHSSWCRVVLDESHDMTPGVAALHGLSRTKWCVTGTPLKGTTSLKRMFTFLFGSVRNAIIPGNSAHRATVLDLVHDGVFYLRQLMLRKTLDVCIRFPHVPIRDVAVDLSSREREVYDRMVTRMGGQVRFLPLPVQYQRYNTLINVANFGLFARHVPGSDFDDDAVDPHFTIVDDVDGVNVVSYPPADDLCPMCIDTFIDPCVTACGHWFCAECMHMTLGAQRTHISCPMCRTPIPTRSIRKRRREPEGGADDDDPGSDGTRCTGEKIKHIFAYLTTALAEAGRKCIVFFPSQFMVDAFSEDAADRGIDVKRVHGRISLSRRQQTFASFQSDDTACRLIAATVKTMSDGLTMTKATDIIIATPTGRDAIDAQIIGRSNRIGRDLSKPLNIVRFVYKDTIEDAFLTEQRQFHEVGARISRCFA